MPKGRVAWLVRGYYGYPLRDEDDWQIIFEEPSLYYYMEVKKVVIFDLE